jgi:hypothetical protein
VAASALCVAKKVTIAVGSSSANIKENEVRFLIRVFVFVNISFLLCFVIPPKNRAFV